MNQTDQNFEWVLINDGKDDATRNLAKQINQIFPLVYLEMEHPSSGFGLCHGRNLGLSVASGDLIAYLDDDNAIAPDFVAEAKQFFRDRFVKCSMVQQFRRRDVVRNGEVVKSGKPFISPSSQCNPDDMIHQREIFDSNGFVHRRINAPSWNPECRIFADYEYLLRCLDTWGKSSFRVNPQVLVDYVQRSDGVIGQSSYTDWAVELQAICSWEEYAVLTQFDYAVLADLVKRWRLKSAQGSLISAFSPSNQAAY